MGNGPLDHPKLLAIEAQLNAGNLDEAQHLLADLGDLAPLRHATTYLATRLLYQRGKLTDEDVAQRLRELLKTVDDFPEASAMLEAAEAGALSEQGVYGQPPPEVAKDDTGPPARVVSTGPPGQHRLDSRKQSSLPTTPRAAPVNVQAAPEAEELGIPRAPALPNVTPATASTASRKVTEPETPHAGKTAPSPPLETSTAETARATPADATRGLDLDLVPPDPGYYSSRPPNVEAVGSRKPSARPSTRSRRGSESRRRPSSVRARPSVSVDETPTLFSVLGLLDDQRHEEALAVLERADHSSSPEFLLMRARALLGLNRREEAVRALRRLCNAPLLEPDLRAGCARLLIGADEIEAAYEQAQTAYEIDASSPVVRLVLAWAAVRKARREEDTERLRLAQNLLETIDIDHGPTPALALGLKACVELARGNKEAAVRAAHRALDMDANCVDALAALALGSARLGKRADAEDAWRRLLRINSEEAHAVRPLLDRVGTPIDRVRPSLAPTSSEPESRRIWDPLEAALINGEPSGLLDHFENLCETEVSKLPQSVDAQLNWLAERAGDLLTRAPGWMHFGPYDFSLWSLLRLQVAIELVYADREPDAPRADSSSLLVLGAYLGESVRLAHDGYWTGKIKEPDSVCVVTSQGELMPFCGVRDHVLHGQGLDLDDHLELHLAHRGELPWSRYKQNPSLPPSPWAPRTQPEVRHLAPLGRALGRSLVSVYCDRYIDRPLDFSVDSLNALDSYLALVSPPHSPVDEDSPSLARVGFLVGCYLGEVLRSLTGGEWTQGGADASSYTFKTGAASVLPIEHVMRRLRGQHMLTLTTFVEETNRALGGT